MNNAKMWLVVSPSVGVPIFLGAVAVGSFAVHMQVVKNTSWVADFLQGQPLGTGDEMAAATQLNETELQAAQASYVLPTSEGLEVTVILPDGTHTQAILNAPNQLPPLISQ